VIAAPLMPGHLAAIAAIEAVRFESPMSLRQLRDLAAQPAFVGFVMLSKDREDEDPMAYALCLAAGGGADLVSIATAPDAERRGVATRLLDHGLAELAARGCEDICLEVAIDNVAALALYHRLGFAEVGRRTGYYRRGGGLVDAIVMRRQLRQPVP